MCRSHHSPAMLLSEMKQAPKAVEQGARVRCNRNPRALFLDSDGKCYSRDGEKSWKRHRDTQYRPPSTRGFRDSSAYARAMAKRGWTKVYHFGRYRSDLVREVIEIDNPALLEVA